MERFDCTFWNWREDIPINKRCFDEVIFGDFRQRTQNVLTTSS